MAPPNRATVAAVAFLIVSLSFGPPARAKTFVLPHVLETSGSIADPNSFDTVIFIDYTGDPSSSAEVEIFLFDEVGQPLRGANDSPVADPLSSFLGQGGVPNLPVVVDLLLKDAGGGFPRPFIHGYGIIVVNGDSDNVDLQGFVTNTRNAPFDIAPFAFEPHPVNTQSNFAPGNGRRSPSLVGGPTFRFDDFIETQTQIETTPGAFDTVFRAIYVGGLPGGGPASSVTIDLSVFNDDGSLMMGAGGIPIADDIPIVLDAGFRFLDLNMDSLFLAAGGFANPTESGFITATVTGDIDNLVISPLRIEAILPLAQMNLLELPRTDLSDPPPGGVIPEPASVALLALVPLVLARRRRE